MNRLAADSAPASTPAAPSPHGINSPEQTPAAAPVSRDAWGHDARGNPGETRNPFARKVAALRRALLAAVTEEDVILVTVKLKDMALSGDLDAMELLLAYAKVR